MAEGKSSTNVSDVPADITDLARRVQLIKTRLNRELNDAIIFAQVARPLLDGHSFDIELELKKLPGKFEVPRATGEEGLVARTPSQVAQMLDRFTNQDLNENLLLSSVSRVESALGDVMRLILKLDNTKIKRGPKSGPGRGKATASDDDADHHRSITLDDLLAAKSKEALIAKLIETRVQGVLYGKPRDYLAFAAAIAEVKLKPKTIDAYCEIKATRDIIVHGGGVANDAYIQKSGALSRAELGQALSVPIDYLKRAIVTMKALIEEISGQLNKTAAKEPL